MAQMIFQRRRERGSATIAAVITMIVLGLLGAAYVTLSTTEMRIAAGHRDGTAAQYLAEAGALWARTHLRGDVDLTFRDNTNSLTGPRPTTSSTMNAGSATEGSYTVTVNNPNYPTNANTRKIVSVGTTVTGAKRTVSLIVDLGSNQGMVNKYSTILNNVLFSGIDMQLDTAPVTGNIYSNANITGTATVTGDVNAVGTVAAGVTVTNTTTYSIHDTTRTPRPLTLAVPDLDASYKDYYYTISTVKYPAPTSGTIALSLSNNSTFDMANKVYFVDGDLLLGNSVTLLNMGTFYVTGNITFGNGISMNKVLMIAAGKKVGGAFNPATGNITIPNNTNNSGSAMLIAQNQISIGNNATFNGVIAAFGSGGVSPCLTITKPKAITYNGTLVTDFQNFEGTAGGITSWSNF